MSTSSQITISKVSNLDKKKNPKEELETFFFSLSIFYASLQNFFQLYKTFFIRFQPLKKKKKHDIHHIDFFLFVFPVSIYWIIVIVGNKCMCHFDFMMSTNETDWQTNWLIMHTRVGQKLKRLFSAALVCPGG